MYNITSQELTRYYILIYYLPLFGVIPFTATMNILYIYYIYTIYIREEDKSW